MMDGFYCDCDYGESAEIYRESTHKARKQYTCGECRQPIMPGDTYVRAFLVFDGDAYTLFNCERCNDLMAAFSSVGYCWSEGEFLDAYAEWLLEERKTFPSWLTDLHPRYARMAIRAVGEHLKPEATE